MLQLEVTLFVSEFPSKALTSTLKVTLSVCLFVLRNKTQVLRWMSFNYSLLLSPLTSFLFVQPPCFKCQPGTLLSIPGNTPTIAGSSVSFFRRGVALAALQRVSSKMPTLQHRSHHCLHPQPQLTCFTTLLLCCAVFSCITKHSVSSVLHVTKGTVQ